MAVYRIPKRGYHHLKLITMIEAAVRVRVVLELNGRSNVAILNIFITRVDASIIWPKLYDRFQNGLKKCSTER